MNRTRSSTVGLVLIAALMLALAGAPLQGQDADPAARPAGAPAASLDHDGEADGDEDEDGATPVSENSSAVAMRANAAVGHGLAWLADQQQPDGSWINDVGYKLNYSYMVTRSAGHHPGVTAIACLAFMAGGHYPGRGAYGENVRNGLNFILQCIDQSNAGVQGFITWDGTRMYSHAFATLFLAEVLGMANFSEEEEEGVRARLKLAVDLIVQSQNAQGAWRYAPNAQDADMSICVCQLQALRAARNVGISVPPTTIERARNYISRAYNWHSAPEQPAADRPYVQPPGNYRDGTFNYQNGQPDGSRVSWTLTAAGIAALQTIGNYESFIDANENRRFLHKSIYYLRQHMPFSVEMTRRRPRLSFSYFYGHYYAAQAMYQYSRVHEEVWAHWLYDIRQKFANLQAPDGYWDDQIGRNYATAMACLILQIHQEFLPIFQK